MREVQLASLHVLKEIAQICNHNNLRYCLAWGTLIGAVRHHGFIPWDDDIDIFMPRPDYEKLVSYFDEHKEELLPLQLLSIDNCKDYPYMLTRISDSRYFLDVQNEKPFGLGAFVDIYVLDGVGNTEEEAYKFVSKTCKYPRLMFLSTRKHYAFGNTKGWLKRIAKIPIFYFAKIMGKQYFVNKILSLVDMNSYTSSKYVGCAVWVERPYYGVINKDDIENTIDCKFEDYTFKIPRAYDKLLKIWYGDYMQLPPEEDRIYHHLYTAYRK